MYEYINGKIVELTPTYVVIDTNGTAFFINISLNTFSLLDKKEHFKIFIHQIVREDAHVLFGFAEKSERNIFRLLISVSGIGANTARIILSSLKPGELISAIQNNEVGILKNIKGIGEKTAQRVIIELKDKTEKIGSLDYSGFSKGSLTADEAIGALIMLGFQKIKVEKTVTEIYNKEHNINVEELVKKALKSL
jgi:Holliday junction DNA helicase RuvA